MKSRFLSLELPLAIYVAVSLGGALWVSDDFDAVRFALLAWFGMPMAVLYFGSRALYPAWPRRMPNLARGVVVTLLLVFTAGFVPLVNAVTTDGATLKRTVATGMGVATRDVKRGGLGWVFRTRAHPFF